MKPPPNQSEGIQGQRPARILSGLICALMPAQETYPGSPQVGFIMQNQEKLGKGNYTGYSYLFFPYPFSQAKVQEFLHLVENPLQAEVTPPVGP